MRLHDGGFQHDARTKGKFQLQQAHYQFSDFLSSRSQLTQRPPRL